MEKVLNLFLNILKMFLLLISFVLTFYIVVNNYNRLGINAFHSISNFIPYFFLFILLSINFIFKQKEVLNNTFYNICCCLVFILNLFVVYRTLYDSNMVLYIRLGYDMNFNYFTDMFLPIKLLISILCLSNIIMIVKYLLKSDKNVIKG